MRFKLTLQVESECREIPINYQYELSSVIYEMIARADQKYSEKLHKDGVSTDGKHFKLFSFSKLIVPNYGIKKETERLIINSDVVYWYVSFVQNESMQAFIKGVLENQLFRLSDKISGVDFRIREVQIVQQPEYHEVMDCETLSPICVSRKMTDGKDKYLSPMDESYPDALLKGLMNRYHAINGHEYQGEVYCELTVTNEPKLALIKIKGGTKCETRIRGYRYKFSISLPKELMEIAYEGGLGSRTSMGFGMIEERR